MLRCMQIRKNILRSFWGVILRLGRTPYETEGALKLPLPPSDLYQTSSSSASRVKTFSPCLESHR